MSARFSSRQAAPPPVAMTDRRAGRRRPNRLGLAPPEPLFPFAGEDLRHAQAGRPHDQIIEIGERPAQTLASNPPTVVFPEPMKPIKKMGPSGAEGGARARHHDRQHELANQAARKSRPIDDRPGLTNASGQNEQIFCAPSRTGVLLEP